MQRWSRIKLVAPAVILAAACLFNASTTSAKPEYSRRTDKECNFCHPPGSFRLNDAGKYFQEHHNSLNGYKPKTENQQQTNNNKK